MLISVCYLIVLFYKYWRIYISRHATSVEAMLEEEEQFADQLKEYYAFGDSLR